MQAICIGPSSIGQFNSDDKKLRFPISNRPPAVSGPRRNRAIGRRSSPFASLITIQLSCRRQRRVNGILLFGIRIDPAAAILWVAFPHGSFPHRSERLRAPLPERWSTCLVCFGTLFLFQLFVCPEPAAAQTRIPASFGCRPDWTTENEQLSCFFFRVFFPLTTALRSIVNVRAAAGDNNTAQQWKSGVYS